MSFSYKPLWKLLIDKEMTKKALMQATGISKSTMDKYQWILLTAYATTLNVV